jgi:hypothetical protein
MFFFSRNEIGKRNNVKNIELKRYFAVLSYVKRKLLNRSEAKNLKRKKAKKYEKPKTNIKKSKKSEKIDLCFASK